MVIFADYFADSKPMPAFQVLRESNVDGMRTPLESMRMVSARL
jgi:hypothetical protein